MSEAIKPTPGPWLAVPYSAKRFGLGTAGEGAWMYLQTIYQDASHPEMRANARLIAEAGTVHHETGLTPRQLVERVKELEEALRDMHNGWRYIRTAHGDLYGVGWDRCEDKARAALSKSLPNTVAEVK